MCVVCVDSWSDRSGSDAALGSVELCALSRLWISDILGVGADATTDRLSDAT